MKWLAFNNDTCHAYITAVGRVVGKVERQENDLYIAHMDGHCLGEYVGVNDAILAVEDRWVKLSAMWAADVA